MDMVGEGFLTTLQKSLDQGKVTQAEIDEACRLVLEAKYKLGLFDDPFRYCDEERAKNNILTTAHLAKAREIAGKSFVLLKNEKNILPRIKNGTMAPTRPLSTTRANLSVTWSVSAEHENTPILLEGMQAV